MYASKNHAVLVYCSEVRLSEDLKRPCDILNWFAKCAQQRLARLTKVFQYKPNVKIKRNSSVIQYRRVFPRNMGFQNGRYFPPAQICYSPWTKKSAKDLSNKSARTNTEGEPWDPPPPPQKAQSLPNKVGNQLETKLYNIRKCHWD